MLFDVKMDGVEYFDDGHNWRYSGIAKVNDKVVNVPAGTVEIGDLIGAAISEQLGRELDDEEQIRVDDLAYDVADFDIELV